MLLFYLNKKIVNLIFLIALIHFKKTYDSARREALYNICIEFGIPRKLVGLIKMCLNKTYIRVHIGKNLSDKFTIENGLKQGDAF
jgi:hypothetical protein